MKQFKVTSVLLSAAMCMSMVMTPVSVMADETTATEETQIEETEKQETKETEITAPKEKEKPSVMETEKPSVKETEETQKEEPAETEKLEPEETQKEEPAETEEQKPSEAEETEPKTEETEVKEPETSEQPAAEAEDKKEALNVFASGKCGKSLTWTISDDGVLTISGKGAMYDYSDYTEKLAPWLQGENYNKVEKVVVSKGVTTIGAYAFYYLNATSVSLPGTLKSIGHHAFRYCQNLIEIAIPSSVTSIDEYAFTCCTNLMKINLPQGLTKISDGTFNYCYSLSHISIPGKVKTIGEKAFSACNTLTSVTIPNGVTLIGFQAFSYCDELAEVTIPASVKTISGQAFVGDGKLAKLNLPLFGLETIGESAFEKCYSLTYFVVPFTVTGIGDGAFAWCTGLGNFVIGEHQNSITNQNAFYKCDNLKKTVHKVKTKGETFVFDDAIELKVINPATDGTGTLAVISVNPDLETIVIPGVITDKVDENNSYKYKVTSIQTGKYAPYYAATTKLKSLVIGSNVVSIEDKAFSGFPNLVSVTGGAGLKSIGTRAFEKCPKLKVFNITSKALWKIGPFAFALDKSLKTVQVKKTTKLVKSGVKNSMKGSSVKTVKVKKSKVKKYKKIFKKKNCGKKVKVKK